MPSPSPSLELLVELMGEASQIGLDGFRRVGYELKPDGSLLTPSDLAVEAFFRERIGPVAPGAVIWGEEGGHVFEVPEGLWVIDPIDGTSNYAFGFPFWGITAALYRGGEFVLGSLTLPCQGQTLWTEKGGGVWLNGEPLQAIRPGGIAPHELVGHGDLSLGPKLGLPGKTRHMGAFVLEGFGFVTQGLRAITTASVRLYDCGTCVLAARELGAQMIHFDGRPFHESEWVGSGGQVEPFAMLPPGCRLP